MPHPNPLLDFYTAVGGDGVRVVHLLAGGFTLGEIRRFATARLAWAVPSDEAIDAVVAVCRGGDIVEIGGGRGYWAAMMTDAGARVRCFDAYPSGDQEANRYTAVEMLSTYRVPDDVRSMMAEIHAEQPECFFPVELGGPENAETGDVLFLCWPPMSDLAAAALDAFAGGVVVYVGEGAGGCTGDDAFHDRLASEWRLVRHVAIPRWYSMEDDLEIWRRR